MTPLERGARALTIAQSGVDCFDDLDPAMQETLKEHVAAVLRAIREPSEGMVEAGYEALDHAYNDSGPASGGRQAWQAMIDTALTE